MDFNAPLPSQPGSGLVMSIGGVLPIKNLSQLHAEEKALAQAREQSRLDILLLVVPHRTPPGFDVPREVGDVRAAVGDLRLRLLLGMELGEVLDGQHTPDGHDEPGARLRRQRSVEIHVHPWGMGARRCHRL